VKKYRLWTEFHIIKFLTHDCKRMKGEKEFSDWLLEVAGGRSAACLDEVG
jgi:hypothetical protein